MSSRFRSTTWFVTGATGLVGSAVVKKLRDNDLSVISLVRKRSSSKLVDWLQEQDVQVVYGDLLDPQSYENHLATSDIVVHTAAAVQIKDPDTNWKINLQGTKILLQTMRNYGVNRIVHISTAGVYGISSDINVNEDDPIQPFGPYLESKAAAEDLYTNQFNDLFYTIVRPPYIYGDPFFDRHVIPTLVNSTPRKIVPRVWRTNPKFGFVHAEDIAKLILLIGSRQDTPSKIYNAQSFSVSLSRLVMMINNARDTNTKIVPIPYMVIYLGSVLADFVFNLKGKFYKLRKRAKLAKYNWIFSTQLAKHELGWTPIHRDPSELEILMSEYLKMNDLEEPMNNDIQGMYLPKD